MSEKVVRVSCSMGRFFKLRGVFVSVVVFVLCCVLFWHRYVMWGLVIVYWVSLEVV